MPPPHLRGALPEAGWIRRGVFRTASGGRKTLRRGHRPVLCGSPVQPLDPLTQSCHRIGSPAHPQPLRYRLATGPFQPPQAPIQPIQHLLLTPRQPTTRTRFVRPARSGKPATCSISRARWACRPEVCRQISTKLISSIPSTLPSVPTDLNNMAHWTPISPTSSPKTTSHQPRICIRHLLGARKRDSPSQANEWGILFKAPLPCAETPPVPQRPPRLQPDVLHSQNPAQRHPSAPTIIHPDR